MSGGVIEVDYAELTWESLYSYKANVKKSPSVPFSVFKSAVSENAIEENLIREWLDYFMEKSSALDSKELTETTELVRKCFGWVDEIKIVCRNNEAVSFPAQTLKRFAYFEELIKAQRKEKQVKMVTLHWTLFDKETVLAFKTYLEKEKVECRSAQLPHLFDIGQFLAESKLSRLVFEKKEKITDAIVRESIQMAFLANEMNDEKAILEYNRALQLRPTDIPSRIALAGLLKKKKLYSQALEELRKASELGVEDFRIYQEIESTLREQLYYLEVVGEKLIIRPLQELKKLQFEGKLSGQLDERLMAIRPTLMTHEDINTVFKAVVVRIVPNGVKSFSQICDLIKSFYTTLEEMKERAESEREEVLRKMPETAETLFLRANILFEQGAYSAAKELVEELYRVRGNIEDRAIFARVLLKLNVDTTSHRKKLLESGDVESEPVVHYFLDFLENDPSDSDVLQKLENNKSLSKGALERLAMIYCKKEETQIAKTFFDKLAVAHKYTDSLSFFYLWHILRGTNTLEKFYFSRAIFFDQIGWRKLSPSQIVQLLVWACEEQNETLRVQAFKKVQLEVVKESDPAENQAASQLLRECAKLDPEHQFEYLLEAYRFDQDIKNSVEALAALMTTKLVVRDAEVQVSQTAHGCNRQALCFINENRIDLAFTMASESLKLDPDQPDMKQQFLELFLERGTIQQALSFADVERDAELLIAEVQLLLATKKLERAEELLSHLPSTDAVQQAVMRLFCLQGNFAKAKAYYTNLPEEDRPQHEVWFVDTMVKFGQVVELDATHVDYLLEKSQRLAISTQEEARRYVESACKLAPNDVRVLNWAGTLAPAAEAVTYFSRSLAIDSKQIAIIAQLVRCLFELDRIEEIPKYAPKSESVIEFLLHKAYAFHLLKNYAEEKRYLQVAIRCDPEHIQAHIKMTGCLAKAKDFEGAHSHLLQAVTISPLQPTLQMQFLTEIVENSDWKVDPIADLIRSNKSVIIFLYEKIVAHAQAGNREMAERYLEIAERLVPPKQMPQLESIIKEETPAAVLPPKSKEGDIKAIIAEIERLLEMKATGDTQTARDDEALVRYEKAWGMYQQLIATYGYCNGEHRIKEVASAIADKFFEQRRRDIVQKVAELLKSNDSNSLAARGLLRRVQLGDGMVDQFKMNNEVRDGKFIPSYDYLKSDSQGVVKS